SLGGESGRSIAGAGGRLGSPAGRRDRRDRGSRLRVGGQAGNNDDPHSLRRRRRPGQARSCRQPRPAGRHLTGINFFTGELGAKQLGLLRELVPSAARIAVLTNPANIQGAATAVAEVEAAARTMGLQIQVFNASTGREINTALAAVARERSDALFITGDP